MAITDEALEVAKRIATPTQLAAYLTPKVWGPMESYHVDPWLTMVEKAVLTGILDTTRESFFMINLPPQVGKTSYSGEFLPFWLLGMNPDLRIIFVTYSDDYSRSRGATVREYVRAFGGQLFGVDIDPEYASASDWRIAGHRGGMLSVGIGSQITGRSGDIIIIDDVIKNSQEAASSAEKRRHAAEYAGTIRTRLQPGGTIVITATRWAEDDLSGRILLATQEPGYDGDPWVTLSFPAIAESETDGEIDEDDPLHRKTGEPLPCRFTKPDQPWHDNHFNRIRRSAGMDAYTFACLFQGRPTMRKGGMFPRHNWGWYDPANTPPMTVVARAWDLATTEGGGDWTVGTKAGRLDHYWYVLDVQRQRLNPNGVLDLVKRTAISDGRHVPVLIEQERQGSGKAVLDFYRKELSGWSVSPAKAEGTKEQRATPSSAWQNDGRILLPRDPETGTSPHWVEDFIDEHRQMMGDGRRPPHDDQIDTMSYVVLELMDSGPVEASDPNQTVDLDRVDFVNRLLEDNEVVMERGMPDHLARLLGRKVDHEDEMLSLVGEPEW